MSEKEPRGTSMDSRSEKEPQVAVPVVEQAESVPAGAKLVPCVAGKSYNVDGLEVHALGDMPDSWDVVGRRYPVVTKALKPGEKVKSEPGSMLSMGNNVKISTGFMGGGISGAISAGMSGELLKTTFTNKGSDPETVSMAGNMPFGVLVHLNMAEHQGSFVAKPGAYFASDPEVKVRAKLLAAQSCAACCCGGMSPIVQGIQGEGTAFLAGSGTVAKKTLKAGEKVLVSTEALLGFSSSVKFDVKQVGTCVTCCFGGEGCFNTQLEGPGVVFLQSFGTDKLQKLMPPKGGGGGGGGDGGGGGGGGPAEAAEMER